MKDQWKRTFDAVKMPSEHKEEIRAKLSSSMEMYEKEDMVVNRKIKYSRFLAVAAILAAAAVMAGFAFGDQVIALLGGGSMISGINEDGEDFVSMDTGFAADPVIILGDQIYFILDDSYTDITDQCSESDYYQYEKTDENGIRHVVLVGGTIDRLGWAEFVWDADGEPMGSNATLPDGTDPEWLTSGREALGRSLF